MARHDNNAGMSDGQKVLLILLGFAGLALLFVWAKPYLLMLWQRAAIWHAVTLARFGSTSPGAAFFRVLNVSSEHFSRLAIALSRTDPANLPGATVWKVTDFLMRVVRWIIAPIILLLAYSLASHGRRERRTFRGGEALFAYVQRGFGRYLKRTRSALHESLYQGVHAVGKTAWQWCTENKCVLPDGKLDVEPTRTALRSQLGAEFAGWDALMAAPNRRDEGFGVVLAACVRQVTRLKGGHSAGPPPNRSTQEQLTDLGWVAKEILSYLNNPQDRQSVIRVATRGHRYVSTVLIALLLATRRFGVVPCMAFQGLRQTNRALWYAIESAGRKVAYVEGAGIIAQYEYEMALLHASRGEIRPHAGQVDAALAGIQEALEFEVNERPWETTEEAVWANFDPTA